MKYADILKWTNYVWNYGLLDNLRDCVQLDGTNFRTTFAAVGVLMSLHIEFWRMWISCRPSTISGNNKLTYLFNTDMTNFKIWHYKSRDSPAQFRDRSASPFLAFLVSRLSPPSPSETEMKNSPIQRNRIITFF